MDEIQITRTISISPAEIQEKFVRASGPGGQNVNKVSTAVQLRFDVANSPSLPLRVKQKILQSGDTRLTKEGTLVIIAETKRTQEANRRDALSRLKELIRNAAFVPKPLIPTRPSLSAKKRRLDAKSKRASIKKGRSGRIDFD